MAKKKNPQDATRGVLKKIHATFRAEIATLKKRVSALERKLLKREPPTRPFTGQTSRRP